MAQPLPLIILAGSDPQEEASPLASDEQHRLSGTKGVLPLPGGRILVAELLARFAASERFGEAVLIGPRSLYAEHALDCDVVDTSHDIAETLHHSVEVIRDRFGLDTPVAVISCDVLPSIEDLRAIIDDAYEPVRECAFWGQLIEASPQDMGASSWKPSYRFQRPDGGGTTNVYPGHLIILRAGALRIDVIIGLARVAYRYRNQPLHRRLPGMLAQGMLVTAGYDLANLMRLRLSATTASVPWQCLSAYGRYRHGQLTVEGFERAFARSFVRSRVRRAARVGPVVFSLCRTLSLAKDFDTREEFEEAVRGLS